MAVLRELTETEVVALYEDAGGWWIYDHAGDPKAPHAELTSGLCSDGYIDSSKVLCDPASTELLAFNLKLRIGAAEYRPATDWVVGSPYAAITFSFEFARQVGAKHGFAEKDPENPKGFVWTNRFVIPGGALVLQVEELVTTLGTSLKVRQAVERGNPHPVRFAPDVATLIYRPARLQGGIIDVISLVAREIKSWEPGECPLCARGSSRLRPKQHWQELARGR